MPGSTVDLATAAPTQAGPLLIRPALREVEVAGSTLIIEPRVMQVLLVLVEADGGVVSRDELVARCWNARAVGEDAINRVIAKVRQIARDPGFAVFRLETVTKVGYRLLIHDRAPAPAAKVEPVLPHSRARPAWVIATLVIAAGVTTWLLARGRPGTPTAQPAPSEVIAAAADLETRGLSAVFEGSPEQTRIGIAYLRLATSRQPREARIWGSLAMAYVLSLAITPPEDRAAVVARVREAAGRALALDPNEGRSQAALVSLIPTFGNWSAKNRALDQALARAPPETAPLMFQHILFLANVGRTREALAEVNALAAFSPLLPWIQSARANLLAANGQLDAAEAAAAKASEIWPRDRLTWFTRFYLATYGGKPDQALKYAADHAGWPDQTAPAEVERAMSVARALVSRSPGEADAVLKAYAPLVAQSQADAEQAIRAATAFGKPGLALEWARQLYLSPTPQTSPSLLMPPIGLVEPSERNMAPLFLLTSRSLWPDPQFQALIEEIGLRRYWASQKPGDCCAQPM